MAPHDEPESAQFSGSPTSGNAGNFAAGEGDDRNSTSRQLSVPPITTISPSALRTNDSSKARGSGRFSCHPCGANGPVDDYSEAVQCRKCRLWSHINCVRPLVAPPESDSDTGSDKSDVSWHDPSFVYRCIMCTLRQDTPACDPQLLNSPNKIIMLPAVEDWNGDSIWLPATFVDFDASRRGREYRFSWIEGIVWETEEPADLQFYRSMAHWDQVNDALLEEHQIGAVWLPNCFAPVPDNAESLDPALSHLFSLAVPKIAQILLLMDANHPVIQNYKEYFKTHTHNAESSILWMKSRSFDPSPALEAMMAQPLSALAKHEYMDQDGTANQKMWGPGAILLQLLAIQFGRPKNRQTSNSIGPWLTAPTSSDSGCAIIASKAGLGSKDRDFIQRILDSALCWNLNGETFSHIQNGLIARSPPQSLRALDAMWESVDPRARGKGAKVDAAQLATFEAQFKNDHTVYFNTSDLTFYRRVGTSGQGTSPRNIRIKYQDRSILSALDLPPKTATPDKRKFEGGDVFDSEDTEPREPVKRKKKYETKPTPEDYKHYMNLGQSTPIFVSPWLRSLIWAEPDVGHQELTLAEMNSPATSEDRIIEEPSSTPQLSITGFVYSAELLNDMPGARIYRLVAPEGRLDLFKTQMETFYRVNRVKIARNTSTCIVYVGFH
ncbi:hypothetical protein B0H11DRAFT_2251196 [Mycena galericulata]|nr:hypothetical protein B0H11DRAFT_2251196 [Mycena galericulata]